MSQPDKIGKYPVLRKLGEGATSTVYLCNDPFTNREVAVKLVFQEALTDVTRGSLFRKIFINEAALAGKLTHPHIVQIYDAVAEDEQTYIVMEYVAGGTLEKFTDKTALLSVEKIVEIIFKCTRALDFANRFGVTHRDIKPANILFESDTDIKVSDFGAALQNSEDNTQIQGIGSPAYMSPQQVKEHPLDHQTDIYSLGVVMYQLLTGQLPFQATNSYSMIYQITNIEPPPPSTYRAEIPASIDRIVKKAMHKEREGRYQAWEDFSLDLAEAFRNQNAQAKRDEFADSEKFNTLRALPFFGHFPDVELWEVLRLSAWEVVPAGTVLIKDGDTSDFFCIIASGEVKVTKRKKLLNVLSPGECFGEMSYLSKGVNERGADVTAISASTIITIHAQDVDQASSNCRHFFDRAFITILVERLNLANMRLSSV